MAETKNGGGGDGKVTNRAGNVFSFQANTGKVLKDGSDSSLPITPATELRYKDAVVYAKAHSGAWYSYTGSAWVSSKNPMGM